MSTRNLILSLVLLAFGASTALAETPGLGKNITEDEIKPWNLDVLPDGTNLPPGSGTPTQGAPIYAQKCAVCHGEKGEKPAPGYGALVSPPKFDKIDAFKSVTYYEFATTLFDYLRRAMPYNETKSLTNDELYSVTAYILQLNGIVGENDTMDSQTLPKVTMPNRDGFIIRNVA